MTLPMRVSAMLLLGALLPGPVPAWAQETAARPASRPAMAGLIAARGRDDAQDIWSDEIRPRAQPPATYRTLCVRLCDGYYFPISFQTTRLGLDADAARCTAKCGSGAQLFFHANPGGDVASARSFTGMMYEGLPNAFRHLKERVSGCGCTPDPWSAAEVQRHRGYAVERKAGPAPSPPPVGEAPAAPASE